MGVGKFTSNQLGCARSFRTETIGKAVDTVLVYLQNTLSEFRCDMLGCEEVPENESGLTDILSVGLSCSRCPAGLIFKAESRENRLRGDSSAVDIGIFWELPGQPFLRWPQISTIEAKRLDSGFARQRQREYVYGHDEKGKHKSCGGIERYKKGIHGQDVSTKGILLAYVQTDDFVTWHGRINGWIAELAKQEEHELSWAEDGKLSAPVETDGVATCESMIFRKEDSLPMVHLWVDLTEKKSGGKSA